jgi:type IV pilus assembly protein PilW
MKKSIQSGQPGFSIVELMISIAIGLVMVVFVSSLYVRSRNSYEVHDDNARLQQEARIVMAMIGRNLTQAGYGVPQSIAGGTLQTNFTGQALRACDGGFATPGDTSATACGAGGTPAFEVSYVVNPVVNTNIGAGVDCNGQAVPANANGDLVVTNRFFLATQGSDGQSLFCVGNGGPVAQPLLGNVEDMRLTYGVATSNVRRPDTVVQSAADVAIAEAQAVPIVAPFRGVVTVGVCLQLVGGASTATEQRFRDCAGNQRTATDRKIHVVLNGMFTLRNNSDSTLIQYPGAP